jgi:hypothetical protein
MATNSWYSHVPRGHHDQLPKLRSKIFPGIAALGSEDPGAHNIPAPHGFAVALSEPTGQKNRAGQSAVHVST